MPDLLTHVLGAYVLLTPLTWRVEWIERRHVSLVMVGAMVPDISKVGLVIGDEIVTETLGWPWQWGGIHRLGPAGLLASIGAMGFEREHRVSAFGWLLSGVFVHLLFDLAVIRASGLAPPYLYPITWWHPPSADLLLSSDVWPWVVTSTLAGIVWVLNRRRIG